MIVINKGVIDEVIDTGAMDEGLVYVYAVFEFESPTGRKVWEVCFSWAEADKIALKGGGLKLWEREGGSPAEPAEDPQLEEVDEAAELEAAADQEWGRFQSSGIGAGLGRNQSLYGWHYLRPQVQAWAVALEKKMREAKDRLKRLSDVSQEVLLAWVEADFQALVKAPVESMAARSLDVSLNCVLLTDRLMKAETERRDGDAGESPRAS